MPKMLLGTSRNSSEIIITYEKISYKMENDIGPSFLFQLSVNGKEHKLIFYAKDVRITRNL